MLVVVVFVVLPLFLFLAAVLGGNSRLVRVEVEDMVGVIGLAVDGRAVE